MSSDERRAWARLELERLEAEGAHCTHVRAAQRAWLALEIDAIG